MPRNQIIAVAVFALLATVAIVAWFSDPAHQAQGESRINWPPASPAKP
jgi:hypothetical protein